MTDTKDNDKPLPLIVIFGRANVGKSTLFNCLTEKHQALISNIAGTTRDSNMGQVDWCGRSFEIVDTGGIIDLKHLTKKASNADNIADQVQRQASQYLKQADLVIFLVDNKAGLLPQDKQMALLIKKNVNANKVLLTVNKVDAPKDRLKISEFYKLSLGQLYPVSAANGSGTGDLLDVIVEKLATHNSQLATRNSNTDEAEKELQVTSDQIRVCIIGKPNVGKSSLLNSILGYERVIVSPEPHTTREPQHTKIIYQDQPILLIDTAGISKNGAKTKGLEKFGIAKSLNALSKSDIALMTVDISQDITRQDAKLIEKIVEVQKSFIFIANKWDKVKKRDTKKYTNDLYGKLPFARFAPIQFTSALTGEKIKKILCLVIQIAKERKLQLSDSQLAHFLARIVKIHRPAKGKGVRHPRIREFTQTQANPPKFEMKIGAKEDLHFSYLRFIENRLRETYGFLGTPMSVSVAKKKNVHGLHQD
ncbi:ribosome biogenesis GTPase Der [Patescibacteria group bacterium]|nr:ribosome biogenesis GTPase Der [Patescibacteria group bacterium]MBU1663615.1 ribosome biogenesis GTPase Der [Patescibacteria group bacterium]MBU1934316.1 ribosome biogenesis GTPase Der [Patescibacteria group bacterium]MBU2233994.1 ribosome biogenesis GTPase Der [Patescibacteria group bacterium]MBU2264407.1 ribosome biogenesis GTPase Der [Patescibacteria group bacterium]